MKKVLVIVGIAVTTGILSPAAFANSTPNFQVQIFPLECSLDSVALGNVSSLQLTPENCLDQPPEPPSAVPQPVPGTTPSPFFPSGSGGAFLQNPALQIPSSNLPISDIKGPLIIDTRKVEKEKTADQQQASIITVSAAVLLGAGVLVAANAVYTGVLAPLVTQGNVPKIRFPWSKK